MSDLYTRAIAKVLGISESDVTPRQRADAKKVCFTAFYGGGPEKLRLIVDRLVKMEVSGIRDEEVLFNDVCEMLRLTWGVSSPS